MTDLTVLSADARTDATWWRQAVVYQVYPRSFADSDGDGLGDLPGLASKIPYLAGLGVDAIWLSPFYPSALADGGYDVADYRDVHPQLGTLADFDDLMTVAHGAGIKVIVDIVPNHTSDLHQWFAEALASAPGSAARQRYIFRDGKGPDGSRPPSDWISHFGGSAWTRVPDGQWYCHLFAPEQPDLNWDNREVRDDFLLTLRFWADRGVDGFRVDVAHALAKDLSEPLRSKPTLEDHPSMPTDGTDPLYDRDEVHEIYREWREVFDSYDPPRTAVAEACAPSSRRALYARPTELGQAFNFDLLAADYDAADFRAAIAFCLSQAAASGSSSTWVLSNHDVVRHATRYALPTGTDLDEWLMSDGSLPRADEEAGLRRARAATALMLALPGSSYFYQGEELGLHEVADLPANALQDPIWLRTQNEKKGRDGCRVPLPWHHEGNAFGFSTGHAWLPQPAGFSRAAVAAQEGRSGTTLEFYREALRVRHQLQTAEELTWVESDDPEVLHFTRPGGWHCLSNFGTTAAPLPDGVVRLTSGQHQAGVLPPETTVWLTEWAPLAEVRGPGLGRASYGGPMEYVKLGSTGLDVSPLCVGCMTFGEPDRGPHPWTLTEDESRPLIRAAIEAGINFFDTANVYSAGSSEEIVGRALAEYGNRDELVIATKVHGRMGDGPNRAGLSRKAIFAECDASLRRLGVDHIDLYQIHRWDRTTPIEETLQALSDLVDAGKVRHLGASSMYAWQFSKALYLQRIHGWHPFVTMQDHYNLLNREEEREMYPLCADQGIGVIPWSPLARGRLTRPWGETTSRSETDTFGKTLYDESTDRVIVERVAEVAAERGVSPAQVALAWVSANPVVSAPIVGLGKQSHLDDALASLDLELTAAETERLEDPYVPHPVIGF